MATGKSQSELEQPAKVYQLEALESKVSDALVKLDTIITQTKGVVTQEQLDSAKNELKKHTEEKVKESEKKIHLRYSPMQDNLKWFVRAVIGQGIVIIAGLVVAAIAFFGPKG